MNRDQAKDLLADYLGGELDDVRRREFEAHLAGDPDLAAEVDGLRRALAAMRALDASAATPTLTNTSPRTKLPRALTLLRYAAIIVFAFGAGYLTRHLAKGHLDQVRSGVVQPRAQEPAENWETRVAVAYARQAGRSGLARSLVALAQATREP